MDITAETWRTLSALLDEALDLPPPQRAAWLESLDRTQPALTPALRRLLAAHATPETADVLARLPVAAAQAPARTEATARGAGDRIGPYRLVRLLGSGGMADVWLADRADGAFMRSVALKMPRVSLLRPDLAARLMREQSILARLEHPRIARLYDAGVDAAGIPYLAMEFVAGVAIDAHCDARRLDVRARLSLFMQVLDAVQFAHARLVIHRDLKPSNIVVSDDGGVRLLDFGIAKLLEGEDSAAETRLTQAAGRALTPDFASPEQIRGEPLTTASDVYSLGVLLYELLSGRRPYRLKLASLAQLEQAILDTEPVRPSAALSTAAAAARATTPARLRRQLAGDLDTIVLKALAKTTEQRYATASTLADDLQRFLDGQPIRARRASLGERARKFVARNRLPVTAAAATAAALVVAIGLTAWQAREATQQAARAEAVKAFLVGLFEANSLTPGDGVHRRALTAGELLDDGAQRLGTRYGAEPALRIELQGLVGRLLHDLASNEQALAIRTARLAQLDAMAAPPLQRAQALADLADTLAQRGDTAAARVRLQQAIDALRKSGRGAEARLHWSLASSLGYLELQAGDRERGTARIEQAAVELQAIAPQSVEYGEALLRQAEALSVANRADAAMPLFTESLALLEQQLGPQSIRLARLRYRVAAAFASQRRLDLAEQQYRLALQTLNDTAGPAHPGTAAVQLDLGRLTGLQGRPADARALLEPAAAVLLAREASVDPLYVAQAQLYLAETLLDEGRIGAAGAPLTQAMARFAGIDDPGQVTVAQLIHARYLLDVGRYDEALLELERARARRRAMFGNDHPAAASVTNRIGLVLAAAQRTALAERAFNDVLQTQPNVESAFGSPRQLAALNLAALDIERGRHAQALPVIEQALAKFESLPPAARNRTSELSLRLRLARALLGVGRAADAQPQLEQARALMGDLYEHAPPRISWHTLQARYLAATGNPAGARDELRMAQRSLAAQGVLGPHFARTLATAEAELKLVLR